MKCVNRLPQRSCCSKAECYGLLLFGRSFSRASVCMVTENAAVAHRVAQLAAQVAGVIVDLRSSISRRKENRNTFSVTVEGDDQRNLLLHTFGHEAGEINLRIHRKKHRLPGVLGVFSARSLFVLRDCDGPKQGIPFRVCRPI